VLTVQRGAAIDEPFGSLGFEAVQALVARLAADAVAIAELAHLIEPRPAVLHEAILPWGTSLSTSWPPPSRPGREIDVLPMFPV
jgi:hypothetical protein